MVKSVYNPMGGNHVEAYITAVASLIVLVPIMLLLPMEIPRKSRLGLIFVAFAIACIGLWANTQYPVWLTGIILLLLAGLAAIILANKIDLRDSKKNQSETRRHENIHTQETEEPIHISQATDFREENKNKQILLGKEPPPAMQPAAPLEFDVDISFLMEREELLKNENTNIPSSGISFEKEVNTSGYMTEIEKLLEEDSIEKVHQTISEDDSEIDEIVIKPAGNAEVSHIEKTNEDEEVELEEIIFHR
jgi:hypothetical protein